jgi:hypothetical protein
MKKTIILSCGLICWGFILGQNTDVTIPSSFQNQSYELQIQKDITSKFGFR